METKLRTDIELSLLYELSLSIGGTLDLKKASEDFLNVWMSKKNIDFGSIWIKNEHLGLENPKQFSLVFAQPHSFASEQTQTLPEDFSEILTQEKAIRISSECQYFQNFNKEKNIKSGSYWFIEIPNLGFIKFFFYEKNPSQKSFNLEEIKTTEKVLDKLSMVLHSCLAYNKINTESGQKNNEKELKEAQEKAEHAGKIKQQFLSVVSHEIRTPLNGIIGMSNLLQKTQLSPQQSDYLNTIQISTENLSLIINSILDFSKIESGLLSIQVIPFNLKKILQNIINGNEFKAEQKGLGLFLKLDPKIDSHLLGDGIRLSQVLLNLISNAIKFTITGKIELEIRLVSKMNNALVLEFIVEDTGKGIPDKMQEIIFESFTQEDSSLGRKYGGTGLGLSISQKLVSLMGGELILTSQENVGTKVSFILGFPISQEPSTKSENSTVSDNILIGKKTLLVEDNPMNQFFAQKLLEGWAMKVDIANNGKEGVEMFNRKQYDCILMDIQMPEMDGIQATKIIRETNKYIPIIALTALSVEEEANNFRSVGMNDFITKPYEAEYLKKKLMEYMLIYQSGPIVSQKSNQLIEEQVYNNSLLTQMMKGNQVQIRQIEQLFVNQVEEVLKQMHQYFLLENWKEIGLLAHKLKASIDMLQITNLKQVIRKLESIEKNKTEKRVVDELIGNVTETLQNVCLLIKNSHK